MTARRLGADEVTLVCLEQRDEMPAHEWELVQATTEGIEIMSGWGPSEFVGEGGKLNHVKFKRCVQVFDDKGSFNPKYDESDAMELVADFAIIAIGQKVESSGLDLNIGAGGRIKVDLETMMTDSPKIFAAGDDVSGPSSVVEAVASGRRAAVAIDGFLGGSGLKFETEPDEIRDDPFLGRDEMFHQRDQYDPKYSDPQQRVKNFDVIELSLTDDEARDFAAQCLRCNLRATISPVILPPDKWQLLTLESVQTVPEIEGVYQIADNSKQVTKIVGTADVKGGLLQELEKQPDGTLFCWEEDRMYSKRESELIQQYLQQYGEMPGGGDDDLDDLF
jgi:hypothetical protein